MFVSICIPTAADISFFYNVDIVVIVPCDCQIEKCAFTVDSFLKFSACTYTHTYRYTGKQNNIYYLTT